MQKIIVASQNPVKINAALAGFTRMFPHTEFIVEGAAVESGVNDQPIGNDETYQGALNRLEGIEQLSPNADYWVAIEGGVEIRGDDMEVSAWIVIKSKSGQIGKGKSGSFILPPSVAAHVHEGKELGTATDLVFDKKNSKQGGGSVGELTEGAMTRTTYYESAVIYALIPFKNPDLYPL